MITARETQDHSGRRHDHRQQTGGQVVSLDAFRRDVALPDAQVEAHQLERLRRELTLAFSDLGGAVFALAHHGGLVDPRLASRVQRIEQLYAALALH